jgi:tetratricopeptide (TPR) repeat protein
MRFNNITTGFPLIILLLYCNVTALPAQEDQYLLSSEVYEVISAAREHMDKNEYAQAESKLTGLLSGKSITPYEQAVANQTLGYVYIATDNYPRAAAVFVKSVEANALPPEVSHDINFIIAQLLANDGKYKESLSYLNAWFANEADPKPDAHMLAATIYYQLEDYNNMIPQVQKAIEKSGKPEQGWYEMLLAGYFEIRDHRNAAGLLEKMIRLYPDKDVYWLQLGATYQLLKQYKKSLAIYELALKKNILDETEIIRLVQLYLNEELPYKAGRLLDDMIRNGKVSKSVDNLELLANSWMLAKEYDRATGVLAELAQIKNDPAVYFRTGQIYFEQEKWGNAVSALEQAVKGEKLGNIAEAWLLLGIAAFHNNDHARSAKALNRAASFKNTNEQAQWWLNKLGHKMKESGSS